jgi:hypothetical protein
LRDAQQISQHPRNDVAFLGGVKILGTDTSDFVSDHLTA